MKKIFILLIPFILVSCSGHKYSREVKFTVPAERNEDVWSSAHSYLARHASFKYRFDMQNDYVISVPFYYKDNYNLLLTRKKDYNNYTYYLMLYGVDFPTIYRSGDDIVLELSQEIQLIQDGISVENTKK